MSELQSKLDDHREASNAKHLDETKAEMAQGARELVDRRIAEQALGVGDLGPNSRCRMSVEATSRSRFSSKLTRLC